MLSGTRASMLALVACAGVASHAAAGVSTFPNAAAISIPASGAASPSPSVIAVAGLVEPVGLVRVKLFGLNHTNPDDLDMLLVGPTGVQVRIMSDCGGSTDAVTIDLTLDDSFPALPDSTALATGTFRPTNFGAGADGFAGTLNGNLGAFRGTDGNGNWSLFVVDDSGSNAGSIDGGWALEIVDSICVTTTANAGAGSLREAIQDANSDVDATVICFNIPASDPGYDGVSGTWRIQPTSVLPTISTQTTIDGLTQPGSSHATWPPTLNIILDGSSVALSGLTLNDAADGSLIRGLVIQNFGSSGILLSGADLCRVQCNFIGTDHTGSAAAGNGDFGVNITADFFSAANDNIVGVDGDGNDDDRERNLISGNDAGGIGVFNSSNSLIAGNYIGVAADGLTALPNGQFGVGIGSILGTADTNRIGTNADGVSDELERNIVSGNAGFGVYLYSNGLLASTRGNSVMGNFIGAGADGQTAAGNSAAGVRIEGALADDNRIGFDQIGADDPAKANLIAFNTGAGVAVLGEDLLTAAQGNWIRGNSIHSNGGLGIDLGDDGVTLNDDGDSDNGANEFKNFPIITSIVGTAVNGTYNSIANTTYDIDIYQNASADPSNHGEGEVLLGSTTVTTDGSGDGVWTLNVVFRGVTVFISATATDRGDSRGTSEFSAVESATVGIDCVLTCADITVPSDAEVCSADVDFGQILSEECDLAGYTVQCTIDDGMGGTIAVESGDPFPIGTTTVTCILFDPPGNQIDECTFTVTVTSVDMPTIVCPADVVTTTDAGICGASVTFSTSVIEPCDTGPGIYELVCIANGAQITSPHVFPLGTTTVECCIFPTALLGGPPIGAIDCCTFTVTVNDNEDPVIVCRQDVEIEVTSCDPIVLTADDVLESITDNCCTDGFIVSIEPSMFQCPQLGVVNNIAVTVQDCNGNTSTCVATVTFVGPDCNLNGQSDYCDVCSGFSLDCNDNWIPDECECYWCQGDLGHSDNWIVVPDENAQLSHEGGGAPNGARVADDFYLEPGCVHRITAFRARVLNNSQPQLRKARLDFYDDCNGKPADEPFATFLSTEHATIIDVQPAIDGFSLLTYRFDLCDECLILDGGKAYWVSIVGITDNINNDLTYWVATDPAQQILGSVPVKADGTRISWTEYEYGDWMHIDECCIGCVNFEFCLDGFACPIIWDNGKPDLGPGRGGSPSGGHQAYDQRTADSMVVKTCEEAPLCYIEAWIWSNCEPLHGFIEVYRDLPCGPPELELLPFRIYSGDEIDAKKFEETWVYNNKTLNLWRLVVKDPDLTLLPGTNYWFSAGAYSTGNFATQSYFANAAPGCDPCTTPHTFKITPGQVRSLRPPATEWAAVVPARDFAFRIAKQGNNVLADSNDIDPDDGDGNATPACIADSNTDGNITVDDIFFFLSAWFNGCP